jgi:hypothetical protein
MQEPTKPTETPKIIKYADAKYTPDTLQKLDARRIIFAAVSTQSPKQYVDLFYFERNKLRRLHALRKDHKALYLNARDYVLKNRELFDELYIGQDHFIYVKKFIEVRPNPHTRSLDYLRNNQTFAGPKFELEQYTMPICLKHKIPYRALSLNSYLSLSEIDIRLNAKTVFGVEQFTWLIDTIISILVGLLCGGSGVALIANGLPGIFAGAVLSLVVLFLGKNRMQSALLNINIPLPMRRLLPKKYLENHLESITDEVRANFYESLEKDKNEEISERLVREISEQIEECLTKMARVVEIPLVS